MYIQSRNFKQLLREYEKERDASARALQTKQAEIYQKIPRIAEIDHQLTMTGIKISKAILEQPGTARELIQSLQEKNMDLTIEKAELLFVNGYPKDYLTPVYGCSQCKDTGYIDTKPCSCLQQKIIDLSYAQSNLKDILAIENFDNFEFRYYSDTVDPQNGKSPRQNMQQIFKTCVNFTDSFPQECNNLLLYGQSGLGKTFLCNCIAKELLDRGRTVLYLTAFQLFKMIEDERFHKDKEDEPNEYLDMILNVDLFIIDDLGTEFSTILTSSELFNFLNSRLLDKKSTIISTNLNPSDWRNQYSDRIVSRILGNYTILKFFGDDIRLKKKYNR